MSTQTTKNDNTVLLSRRGRVAALSRSRRPEDPDMVAAQRDLAAEQLASYIRRVVHAAPTLTAAQRAELTVLLGGE